MDPESPKPAHWLEGSKRDAIATCVLTGVVMLTGSAGCSEWASSAAQNVYLRRTYDAVLVLDTGDVIEGPEGFTNCECGAFTSSLHHFNRILETEPDEETWRSGEVPVIALYTPSSENDSPNRDNVRVIGFLDGLPRECMWIKCMSGDCIVNSKLCIIQPNQMLTMGVMDTDCDTFFWETGYSVYTGMPEFYFESYGTWQARTEGPTVEITPHVPRLDISPLWGSVQVTDKWGRTDEARIFVRCPDTVASDPSSLSIPCGDSKALHSAVLTASDQQLRPWYQWRWKEPNVGYFESLGWQGQLQSGPGVVIHGPPCWEVSGCSDEEFQCEDIVEQVCNANNQFPGVAAVINEIHISYTDCQCGEPLPKAINIGTTHLQCEECVTATSADNLEYMWRIQKSWEGTWSYEGPSTSAEVCAPDCDDCVDYNPDCTGYIQLDMGCGGEGNFEVIDSVVITFNCISEEWVAYETVASCYIYPYADPNLTSCSQYVNRCNISCLENVMNCTGYVKACSRNYSCGGCINDGRCIGPGWISINPSKPDGCCPPAVYE